jgi:hypothetical protein
MATMTPSDLPSNEKDEIFEEALWIKCFDNRFTAKNKELPTDEDMLFKTSADLIKHFIKDLLKRQEEDIKSLVLKLIVDKKKKAEKGCNDCKPEKRKNCLFCNHSKGMHRIKDNDKSCGQCWGMSEDNKDLRVCTKFIFDNKTIRYCSSCQAIIKTCDELLKEFEK